MVAADTAGNHQLGLSSSSLTRGASVLSNLAGCIVGEVNWRGWYLIVGLVLFGTPALVALGPLGVLFGLGAIVAWAVNRFGK